MATNLFNFKGIYYDNETQKYTCPLTGAHFSFADLCGRLEAIRVEREREAVCTSANQNVIHIVLDDPQLLKSHDSENFTEIEESAV